MTPPRHVAQVLALLLLCGGPAASVRLAAQDTVPAGFGTLKRDDIVVRFATEQLEIQILPLDEQVWFAPAIPFKPIPIELAAAALEPPR